MKRLFLSVVALVLFSAYLKAQDESVIMLLVTQKQYEKAKDEVDKWLAKPKLKDKEKPTALLWKMMVYSDIFTDSALSPKYPDANAQALDAFHQYLAIDPELKQMKDNHFEGAVGNLYSGSFNKGRDFFQEKNWDSSFAYFSEAESLGTFLLTNKLSSSESTMDTVTILYTGYAAQNAKLYDSAAKYYSKLTDVKISGPDYEDIYKFMIEHYSEIKDDANFKKYLDLAKEVYPNDNPTWTQYEMNNMTANARITELYQNYLKDAAAGGMNEDKLIGYAEALATNDQTQLEGIDSTTKVNIKLASADAFGKAFNLSNNGLYAFNVGVIYYSIYSDLDDRYAANRGESAALKAKRAEIAKQEMAYSDTASQWLEKAFPILQDKQDRSRAETASLNRLVDYLANIYYWQREQTKTNGKSADYDRLDALYKKYDALHATFK
ncbi:MAG: hypothetical protein JST21_05020 [Bacteroidetes bacterium]|nr:hypothetical protein [Bacteroidota bacterium]